MGPAALLRNVSLFPLRALVFGVGLFCYWMEVAADWLVGARDHTEYVREGACRRCGRCCRLLALIMPPFVSKRRWLVSAFRTWHSALLNFEPLGENEGALIYQCRYYRDDGGHSRCRIYPFRHRLCRFFPRQSLYGRPLLHEECGFRFIRRDVLARRCERAHEGKPLFDDMLRHK